MIYLDHAATTACAPEVVEAMLPFFRENFANASSTDHILGSAAKDAVEKARESVARFVGAQPEDVIFTSGSTEANNLALSTSLPVTTTPIEHPSILDVIKARNRDTDTFVEISREGLVTKKSLESQVKHRRCLVTVIATNNEIGVEQDLDFLSATVNAQGSMLHLDATQATLTREINVRKRDIAGCSISAHKIYGPKGIGALVATAKLRREIRPVLHGGGHERGLRSGTLNVPAIVGFGVAAQMAERRRVEHRANLELLRDRFLAVLSEATNGRTHVTVPTAHSSPHILSVRIEGTNARALLRSVREEVAFSLGSACATNKAEPSHVLLALGLDKKLVAETIRCSFSVEQTADEMERAARTVAVAARSLAEYSIPN